MLDGLPEAQLTHHIAIETAIVYSIQSLCKLLSCVILFYDRLYLDANIVYQRNYAIKVFAYGIIPAAHFPLVQTPRQTLGKAEKGISALWIQPGGVILSIIKRPKVKLKEV